MESNSGNFSVQDVINQYEEKVDTVKNDFDVQVQIESWQIDHVTSKGLYLNVDFGVAQHGIIFIGAYKTDELDSGDYNLYLKYKDYFYFMDTEGAENNRFMMGRTLIRQLGLYNGTVPVAKEAIISTINELTDAINFLAGHGVAEGGNQLAQLEKQLFEAMAEARMKLKELDRKIASLNREAKVLMASVEAINAPVLEASLEPVENQLASTKTNRSLLKEKLNETTAEINQCQGLLYAALQRQSKN